MPQPKKSANSMKRFSMIWETVGSPLPPPPPPPYKYNPAPPPRGLQNTAPCLHGEEDDASPTGCHPGSRTHHSGTLWYQKYIFFLKKPNHFWVLPFIGGGGKVSTTNTFFYIKKLRPDWQVLILRHPLGCPPVLPVLNVQKLFCPIVGWAAAMRHFFFLQLLFF